jgi:CarD family transcriptional regulator
VINDKLIVERKSLSVPGEDASGFLDEKSTCRSKEQHSCTNLEQFSCADLLRVRKSLRVERLTMVARNKSKKTTSSKKKKTVAASSAKPRSKRTPKAASSSSARTRVSKSKLASNTRVARKTVKTSRAKIKSAVTKVAKRKRTTNVRTTSPAKRPATTVRRKVAATKSVSKATKTAAAAKAAATVRARLKEKEAKSPTESQGAHESRAASNKGTAQLAASKPNLDHGVQPSPSVELAPPAKSAAPVVKVQKAGGSEEASSAAKTLKSVSQRQGFKLNEFVVYPAHGVGQITAIEEQEVAGFKLELFVIGFSKDKLTLRVPTSKVSGVGMRKISDADTARRSLDILTGRARVKRTMWSRRAQEYETKINSGDINAIAEVVRDLYRSEAQPEQSYSERQLYEAALDRMVREIAAVQKSNEIDALKTVEAQLQKGQSRAAKALHPPGPAGEIEQAA